MARGGPHHVEGHDAVLQQIHQVLIEGLHAVLLSTFRNVVPDLRRAIPVADQIPDGRRDDHDLERRDAALAIGLGQQPLRDHRLERLGEPDPRDLLLLRREHRHNPGHRRRRIRRVKRREEDVPGLRRLHCGVDGLGIPQLAD